jgi:hypothetical protein
MLYLGTRESIFFFLRPEATSALSFFWALHKNAAEPLLCRFDEEPRGRERYAECPETASTSLTSHPERINFYGKQSKEGSGYCREVGTGTAARKPDPSVEKRQRTIYGQAGGHEVSEFIKEVEANKGLAPYGLLARQLKRQREALNWPEKLSENFALSFLICPNRAFAPLGCISCLFMQLFHSPS